jgi:hypothetical protein
VGPFEFGATCWWGDDGDWEGAEGGGFETNLRWKPTNEGICAPGHGRTR